MQTYNHMFIYTHLHTCVLARYDDLPLNLVSQGVEIEAADYLAAVVVLLLSLHSSSAPGQLQVVRDNWSTMDSASLDKVTVMHVSWSGVFETFTIVVLW